MSIEVPPAAPKVNRGPKSEIFTKFADVKSRVSWTDERRQLLQEMWDRGDKAPAIAAALGCKVGAVNVARARFGLKPRRIVSGRPKEADEPAHKIERVAFTVSRLVEYCNEKELVAQTGHESSEWPRVIVKELVDNGLDHCEERRRHHRLHHSDIEPGSLHLADERKAGQRAEVHFADVLRDRRQGAGRDVDRGARHQASARLQR
jgi:hypothetical protein